MKKQITVLAALAACLLAACANDSGDESLTLTPVADWTAEPEYEIGDQMEGDALFGRITSIRPAADGSRVYVLDIVASELTIWTPDGTLISRVGRRGEGPGEFSNPRSLFLFEDGFLVGDNRRYTTFTLDGEVVGTEIFPPPGFGIESLAGYYGFAMFDDGSVVAVPPPPAWWFDGSGAGRSVLGSPGVSRLAGRWLLGTGYAGPAQLPEHDVLARYLKGQVSNRPAVGPARLPCHGSPEQQRGVQPPADGAPGGAGTH